MHVLSFSRRSIHRLYSFPSRPASPSDCLASTVFTRKEWPHNKRKAIVISSAGRTSPNFQDPALCHVLRIRKPRLPASYTSIFLLCRRLRRVPALRCLPCCAGACDTTIYTSSLHHPLRHNEPTTGPSLARPHVSKRRQLLLKIWRTRWWSCECRHTQRSALFGWSLRRPSSRTTDLTPVL